MLTPEAKKKIAQMLQSNDMEMCNLAAELFIGNTCNYSDYDEVRKAYGNTLEVIPIYARGAFNKMFNCLDRNTFDMCRKDYMLRRTVLSSGQRRRRKKKQFKNGYGKIYGESQKYANV